MTATLQDRLQVGVIEHKRRWSGDTHDDLGGTVDVEKTDALMREAASELSRLESACESAVVEIDRLRRERDEWHGRAAESVSLRRERDTWRSAAESKQAQIDRLMLEFCPEEMSAEQRAEWARNQVRVSVTEVDAIKASCAQAAKDAVQFQDERDALAAENYRLREGARQLAIVSARDKYLCGLLVDWSVRANGGEDHGVPPEHILRTLIRQLDLHRDANGALERAGADPVGFFGER